MNASYKKQLERNIVKYSWYKIFTKRVYLPLIAIQLVNIGHVTIAQLAIIAVASSLLQLLLQVPSGYFADKVGNRPAILTGSALTAISPLIYVVRPDFYGGLAADLLFFGGYAFISGAIEAFMHDTLVSLKREKNYAKIMGKAQSYGLVGNIVLLTAIPATYTIDSRLPFLFGFVSLAINFFIAASFTYPTIKHRTGNHTRKPIAAFRSVVTVTNFALFLFAGVLFGVTHRGGQYRELVFQDVGVHVKYFGAIIAMASLLGVVFGFCLGAVDRLRDRTFYLLDLTVISSCMIAVGLTRNPLVVIGAFTVFAAYDRVRLILIQSRLLRELQHTYKATLLSALSLFSIAGEIIMVALLAYYIRIGGYQNGYLTFGIIVAGVSILLYGLVLMALRNVDKQVFKK